jgi:hypothetical protein
MHRKSVIAGTALAVGIAISGVAAGDAAKTKVDISTYSFTGPASGQFQGEVKSRKAKCEEKRKVTIYRDAVGGPVKIGSTKTISGEGTNVFIINDDSAATSDPYYAVAPADNGCKKGRSDDYLIP